MAQQRLAQYDMKREYGYKNQVIAARNAVKRTTGMGVRELRVWLREHPKDEPLA